jgi:hypothetical protein
MDIFNRRALAAANREIFRLEEEVADLKAARSAAIDAHRIVLDEHKAEALRLRQELTRAYSTLRTAYAAIDALVMKADGNVLADCWFGSSAEPVVADK